MLPVTFLSDYGLQDEYVGVCHGVIRRIAPEATIIDITHGVPPRDVRAGALALKRALPYMPPAVHLAVVDPGVGTERRPLALRCADGTTLVGPDNGLLWPAAQACGGIAAAADLTDSPHKLEQVSATFHGRDLFAPAAAQLARDLPVELAGAPADRDNIVRLELPRPAVSPGTIVAHVISIDRFGNLSLDAGPSDLDQSGLAGEARVHIQAANAGDDVVHGRSFGDVPTGESILYQDASGSLAVAINGGDASRQLGIELDDELTLRRCE
jgi:hypothetical protein